MASIALALPIGYGAIRKAREEYPVAKACYTKYKIGRETRELEKARLARELIDIYLATDSRVIAKYIAESIRDSKSDPFVQSHFYGILRSRESDGIDARFDKLRIALEMGSSIDVGHTLIAIKDCSSLNDRPTEDIELLERAYRDSQSKMRVSVPGFDKRGIEYHAARAAVLSVDLLGRAEEAEGLLRYVFGEKAFCAEKEENPEDSASQIFDSLFNRVQAKDTSVEVLEFISKNSKQP